MTQGSTGEHRVTQGDTEGHNGQRGHRANTGTQGTQGTQGDSKGHRGHKGTQGSKGTVSRLWFVYVMFIKMFGSKIRTLFFSLIIEVE